MAGAVGEIHKGPKKITRNPVNYAGQGKKVETQSPYSNFPIPRRGG